MNRNLNLSEAGPFESAAAEKIRVLYSDLDGSMLGPGGNFFLSAEKKSTLLPSISLLALKEKGVDITLISGRSVAQLKELSRVLGIDNYIAEAGCQIVRSGKSIGRTYDYNHGDSRTLHEAITASGAPALLLEAFKGKLEYHTPWSDNRSCSHLFRGEIDLSIANDRLLRSGFEKLKLIDNGVVHRKGDLIDVGEVHSYHLLPIETDKAAAIAIDAKERGLALEELAAIGDSLADISMAKVVSMFFLIDNNNYRATLGAEKLENILLTKKKMGLGWAEAANYICEQK